jgi:predicted ATPase
VLAEELGVEPEVETRALYERLRAGGAAPRPAAPPGGLAGGPGPPAAPPHNLPAALTPFVGREAELAALGTLRRDGGARLLTLVGAGGVGKTRLALEAARAALEDFPDGVFLVPLASLADPAALAATVAAALGIPAPESDPPGALRRYLRDRRLLLLLDNCEHLLAGMGLVADVLAAAPGAAVIATSRQRLGLRGEQVFAVEGLAYPEPGAAVSEAALAPAVRLFVQGARRARPGLALDAANLPAVLRICRLVAGLPLGLELAAAGAGELEPDELAAEIERSADVLAADWPDAPARQRSLRAVFAWSWELLDGEERAVFPRLAVFRGGFTREAAEAVAEAPLRVLNGLVRKSLLRRTSPGEAGAAGGGRYELHELLRQYASERLGPAEGAGSAARHATHYLAFVASREHGLARGAPRGAVVELRRELDNVRAAWAWAAAGAAGDLPESPAALEALDASAYALWQLYVLQGPLTEGEQVMGAAADGLLARPAPPPGALGAPAAGRARAVAGKLLALRAALLIQLGRHDRVLPAAAQAVALSEAPGGPAGAAPLRGAALEGAALGHLTRGQALRRLGQHRAAVASLEAALRLAQGPGGAEDGAAPELLHDVAWTAHVWLASIAVSPEFDLARARDHLQEGLRACRALGKVRGEQTCLANLATLSTLEGDYDAVRRDYRRSLDLLRGASDRWSEADVQLHLSDVERAQGDYASAYARAGLARLALARGDPGEALTQVEAILPELEAGPRPVLHEPFDDYLTAYRVLAAAADSRAAGVLRAAHQRLWAYARRIPDDRLRRSFLEDVATNRALLHAAADAATPAGAVAVSPRS